MKRLITILAVLGALCGSGRAADLVDWFDAGIGKNWPTNATMFGGAWCNGAEMCGRMIDDKTLQIIADEEYPLAFEADTPKSLGSDSAATNVVIEFSCAFQPFSLSALPAVPDDAKGAVILVTDEEDPDEASDGELYYAAYDQGANVWRPSGLKSLTDDFVDVSMVISRGDPGFLGVTYTIRGVTIAASLRQADVIVRDVAYVGMGRSCELSAAYKNVDPYRIGETEYADFATMNAALKDGDTVVVQLNDTVPAGATLSAAAGLTDPSVSTVTIDNVEPGFYYTVVGETDLEGVVTEGRSELANGTSVELTKPDLGNASKVFFRIKATVK